jgi:hypothetical protein
MHYLDREMTRERDAPMARPRVQCALIVLVGPALIVGLAACGSSKHTIMKSTPASANASTTAAASTGGVGAPADAATTAAVTSTFVTLFNGAAPTQSRLDLLQSGDVFATALSSQASSPLLKLTTATVSSVTSAGPNEAHVVYTVLLSGTPALTNQSGTAVRVDGTWKVSATTFCALLSLGAQQPAACTQASVTALPS